MKQIVRYLLFVGFLAAAAFVAANFNLLSLFGSEPSKGATRSKKFQGVSISKKPSSILTGLSGKVTLDYSPTYNLTAAASDDLIMVWQLPDTTNPGEIDSGEGFQALSLRFLPGMPLLAVGGMKSAYTGSVRFFDAVTGDQTLEIDEPEPIQFLDPHPGGKYLLITGETYIKVIDVKDGNSVAILQKNNPAGRAYYYGNGQYLLQSDSLSLFDLNKRTLSEPLDTAAPLLFRKGQDGRTFSWLSAEGVSLITQAESGKKFYPLDTKGITAFDIEPNGKWGLFLPEAKKMVAIEFSTGKVIKTVELTSPASDVTISSDGASAYLQYSSGAIGVYDIGYSNRLKSLRSGFKKLVGKIKSKREPAVKPEPN